MGWEVDSLPDLVIGGGDSAELFHRVRGITGLPVGGVLVVDAGSAELRFFDSQDELLDRTGGRGEGPGEFLSDTHPLGRERLPAPFRSGAPTGFRYFQASAAITGRFPWIMGGPRAAVRRSGLSATLELTKDHRQMEEAYRRMAFNVLAYNRDDHVKNFSYLMDRSGVWRFAPAYDLVYCEGPGGEHTMAVAGEALCPTEREMLRVAEECDMELRRARVILQQVRDAIQQWPRFARDAGVGKDTERRIAKMTSRL